MAVVGTLVGSRKKQSLKAVGEALAKIQSPCNPAPFRKIRANFVDLVACRQSYMKNCRKGLFTVKIQIILLKLVKIIYFFLLKLKKKEKSYVFH